MSIAPKEWNDTNRFNQGGYSASTIFPQETNYTNKDLFLIDYKSACGREESREEWLDELRQEAREEEYYDNN